MFKKRLDNIVQGASSKLMQHAYWYLLAKMQIQPKTRIYKLERTMNDPAPRGRPPTELNGCLIDKDIDFAKKYLKIDKLLAKFLADFFERAPWRKAIPPL